MRAARTQPGAEAVSDQYEIRISWKASQELSQIQRISIGSVSLQPGVTDRTLDFVAGPRPNDIPAIVPELCQL